MAALRQGRTRGPALASGAKIPGSQATVTVAGKKVTIKAKKFAIKCQGPSGKYDMPSAPIKYEFKGTLKGNAVSGSYIPPLGGTGEFFTAKGTFSPAKKSFTGKLSFVAGAGTSTIKDTKADRL